MSANRDTIGAASQEPGENPLTPSQQGKWCKIFCTKNERGQEYYFSNLETGETSWEEPSADYYLWDYGTGTYHVSGLQKPTPKEKRKMSRKLEITDKLLTSGS
jgi:hypothetical protein